MNLSYGVLKEWKPINRRFHKQHCLLFTHHLAFPPIDLLCHRNHRGTGCMTRPYSMIGNFRRFFLIRSCHQNNQNILRLTTHWVETIADPLPIRQLLFHSRHIKITTPPYIRAATFVPSSFRQAIGISITFNDLHDMILA